MWRARGVLVVCLRRAGSVLVVGWWRAGGILLACLSPRQLVASPPGCLFARCGHADLSTALVSTARLRPSLASARAALLASAPSASLASVARAPAPALRASFAGRMAISGFGADPVFGVANRASACHHSRIMYSRLRASLQANLWSVGTRVAIVSVEPFAKKTGPKS